MHHFTERVVFVQRNANKWVGRVSSKNDARRLLAEEEFPGGVESWILQTYLRLREAGNDVELSDRFLEGAINIAHYDDVLAVTSSRFFIVAIKADRDRVFFSSS